MKPLEIGGPGSYLLPPKKEVDEEEDENGEISGTGPTN